MNYFARPTNLSRSAEIALQFGRAWERIFVDCEFVVFVIILSS